MDTDNVAVIEQFKQLPRKLKDALFSEEMTDRIFAVGKENKLAVAQMEILSDEIGLLVLGATKPSVFVINIRKRLTLDQDQAGAITKAVDEKIVAPLRNELMVYHGLPAFTLEPSAAQEQKTVASAPIASVAQTPVVPKTPKPADTTPVIETIKQVPPVKIEETPKFIAVKKPVANVTPAQPVAPAAPAPLFAKQPPRYTAGGPYHELIDETAPTPLSPKQRVVSWENIVPDRAKEPTTTPDAKSALEKALNDVPAPAKQGPINATTVSESKVRYKTSDPYREPLE